jgi:geranylgeranyl reductase family protein
MQRCDALIVGGGPAGSSCAWALRQRGLDVMLLDKAAFPRDKVCGGWITPPVVEALRIDMEKYARSRTLQPITGFQTGMIRGPEIRTDYAHPVSYGIRRCEFDDYLLRRCGARLRLGEPLRSLRRHNHEWIVNEDIRTPLVVGAGGHFCPVARFLGARVGRHEQSVAAKEVEFPLGADEQAQCQVDGRVPRLYFCRDLKGYGWCFRKGDHLNVGIGREDSHGLGQHLRDFHNFLRGRRAIPEITRRFNGHAYLLYRHGQRRLLDDGIVLIGDAAGLAYPHSGEGIRPAVESALIAADTIGSLNGDYRANALAAYRDRLKGRFGHGAKTQAGLIPAGIRCLVADRLMTQHWFTRHVLLDRWFLHAAEAPLHY